jgi:hypothetical protein
MSGPLGAIAIVFTVIGTFLIPCGAVTLLIVDQARNIRQLALRAERIENA